MALTARSQIRDQIVAGKMLTKDFSYNGPAGVTGLPGYQSPWYLWDGQSFGSPSVGADPAAGSGTPGAGGTAYTNATGGLLFPDTSGSKYLVTVDLFGSDQALAAIRIMDRLVGVGGITMNSAAVKNVGSVALPRYTDGKNVEAWMEVSTAGTTTIPTMNLNSYTDDDGNTGQVGPASISFGAATSTRGSLWGPFPLAAGDRGIRSVESINVTVAGGGSGVASLVLMRTIAWCYYGDVESGVGNATPTERNTPFPYFHPRQVFDGATLQVVRAGPSSNSRVEGVLQVIEAP